MLKALREALRRREIWVAGANRWRNPDDDLPTDFEENRDVHYAAIRGAARRRGVCRRPQDPAQRSPGLVRHRPGPGHDRRSADHHPARARLDFGTEDGQAAHAAVPGRAQSRGPASLGVIDLLDMLKNADFLTGFTEELTSVIEPRDAARASAAPAAVAGFVLCTAEQ